MFKRFFVQVLKHKKFSIGIPLVLLPIYIHNIDKTKPVIYNYDERVIEVKSYDDFSDLLQKEDVFIVDFYATWCHPCKILAPKLINKLNEPNQKWKLLMVNVDENSELTNKMGVNRLPTVFLIKNAECHDQIIGYPDHQTLTNFFEKANSI